MKKIISTTLLCAIGLCAMAQSTARQFTMPNSADGQSELMVYLPSAEAAKTANGRAIVDCPGGGYEMLTMPYEGQMWAEYFNSRGIAYIVVKYHLPKGDRNLPLTDAYNGMRTARDSAAVWNINPRNVGIMGFSAGGHLAATVSTHAPFEVRPDFSILIYPVITLAEGATHEGTARGFLGEERHNPRMVSEWSADKAVRRHLTPPAFIAVANDDGLVPPVPNSVAYYTAMRNAGNECEMHIYNSGNHGLMGPSHTYMERDIDLWLKGLRTPTQSDIKVACVGNSITDGHGIDMAPERGYPAQLQRMLGAGIEVKNFGLNGRTMANMADVPYMREMAWADCKAYNPDVVIIKLGTNDTKTQNRAALEVDFERSAQAMIDTLRALPSKPTIVLCTPIPAMSGAWTINDERIKTQVNPALERLAKKNKLQIIDLRAPFEGKSELMQPDGIHPNDKGVMVIATTVAEAIKKAVESRK